MSAPTQERTPGAALPDGVFETVTRVVETLAHQAAVAYVEVVLTLPASVGATVDPTDVDAVRTEVVRACSSADGARAACILLVSPAEVPTTLSVASLLEDRPDAEGPTVHAALDADLHAVLQNTPFELRSAVTARVVTADEVRTLASGATSWRRVDVALVGTQQEDRS